MFCSIKGYFVFYCNIWNHWLWQSIIKSNVSQKQKIIVAVCISAWWAHECLPPYREGVEVDEHQAGTHGHVGYEGKWCQVREITDENQQDESRQEAEHVETRIKARDNHCRLVGIAVHGCPISSLYNLGEIMVQTHLPLSGVLWVSAQRCGTSEESCNNNNNWGLYYTLLLGDLNWISFTEKLIWEWVNVCFSVGHLLHIVTEEDKVNTAESELSDDKKQVH